MALLINSRTAAINPITYAEMAPHYESERQLDLSLVPPSVFKRLPLPYTAGFPAASAFLEYRKAGGAKTSPLPYFFFGAHAEAEGLSLLTRDAARYQSYFSESRAHLPLTAYYWLC